MSRRKTKTTAPDMPTGVLRQWPDCVQQYRRMIAYAGCSQEVLERLSPETREWKLNQVRGLVERAYYHPMYGPHSCSAEASALAQVIGCPLALEPEEILKSINDDQHPIRVALTAYSDTHVVVADHDDTVY